MKTIVIAIVVVLSIVQASYVQNKSFELKTNDVCFQFFNILALTYVLSIMLSEVLFNFKQKIKYYWLQFLITKLYCFKCLTFWLTLVVLQDVYLAAINTILAIIIEKLLEDEDK